MSFFTPEDERARQQAIADAKNRDDKEAAILRKYCQDAVQKLLPEVLQRVRQDYLSGERSCTISYSNEALRARFGSQPNNSSYNISIEQELHDRLAERGLKVEIDYSDWKQKVQIEVKF
jgi:hypothetical protein